MRSRRAAAWATATLLAGAPAAVASSPEAGAYTVEAFRARTGDARLPPELRKLQIDAAAQPAALAPALAGDGAVEIRWRSREGFGLRGYRVTATIEGGALSGVTTRFTVAPGTGERHSASGSYAYRLRLPLPADPSLHLHAALEAIREDGSPVLLGVREASAPESGARPGWDAGAPRASGTAGRSLGAALLPTPPDLEGAAGSRAETLARRDAMPAVAAFLPAAAARLDRSRGPPSA